MWESWLEPEIYRAPLGHLGVFQPTVSVLQPPELLSLLSARILGPAHRTAPASQQFGHLKDARPPVFRNEATWAFSSSLIMIHAAGGATFDRTVAIYSEICSVYQAAHCGEKKSSAAWVDGFETVAINVWGLWGYARMCCVLRWPPRCSSPVFWSQLFQHFSPLSPQQIWRHGAKDDRREDLWLHLLPQRRAGNRAARPRHRLQLQSHLPPEPEGWQAARSEGKWGTCTSIPSVVPYVHSGECLTISSAGSWFPNVLEDYQDNENEGERQVLGNNSRWAFTNGCQEDSSSFSCNWDKTSKRNPSFFHRTRQRPCKPEKIHSIDESLCKN